jgi:kynureninase
VNSAPAPKTLTRESAVDLDRSDPLGFTRSRFSLPDGVIYLDGNSLGALPASTAARLQEVVTNEWGRSLIRGWNEHGWMEAGERVGASIGRLIGANGDSVIVADNTSTNIFKLATAALRLRPNRGVVVTEADNFPSDLYVLEGIAAVLGHEIRRVDRSDIGSAIDHDTALVVLTEVDYRSGRRFDMASITVAAHEQGALMLWDLAHSAGAHDVALDALDVDFAVGCGYKFLNGGPGAPAFCYVNRRLVDTVRPMIQGWLGHVEPFEFAANYEPADGIRRLMVGTPPVLSMASLSEGVATFDDIQMTAVRAKGRALTELFIDLIDSRLQNHGFELVTPRDASQRGSQVSLGHEHGYAIMQALIARGVIGDFRPPNLVRFGIAPLYVRFVDVFDAVQHLVEVMETREYEQARFLERNSVT